MQDRNPHAYQRLADLLIGAKIAIALRAMAEHGIADRLADGPVPVGTLAESTGLSVDPLRRVLRALSQYGVFRERADGRFENTDISDCMRSEAAASLREMILFLNHNASLRAWLQLEQTLADGRSRFVDVNGAPLFKLFAEDKRLGEHFAKCMNNIYGPEAAKIANGFPFGEFRTVIDVGGGIGHVLAAILAAHQTLRGMLFDIEPTAVLAANFMRERGLADRCGVIGGDFFVEVPSGYDAYVVKSVLHDWDDARATAVLRQCRIAMADHSRLLILEEVVVPGQPVHNPHRFVDLDLLVHLGGKERTEAEYGELMKGAGFALTRIVPVKDSFFSVIEGAPVSV
jgi:hypothetical protein